MAIEEDINQATCRVDKADNQLGSAFSVGSDSLVTAAHVVEPHADDGVSIETSTGESFSCEVEHCDPTHEGSRGTDLALLQSEEELSDSKALPISSEIPSVGVGVLWSGYARLFGESKIERQRFGWGRVASKEYGENNAQLFEVDGLFNPSHSGGPVISEESEEVVGVVSASAGGFDNLEEAWSRRSNLLNEAFDFYSERSSEAHCW